MINPLHALDHAKPFGRGVLVETSALDTVRDALQRIGPRRLLLALDLAAVVVIGAAFAQVGPPELLFHVAFVILTVEAFNFGRRICLQRIGAVSVALVAYAALPVIQVSVTPLELSEWPLMFTIAVLVAWMADREQSVGRRYAGLYRETRDRLIRAQEEERGRIARDLHDGIGQTLTALTLTLDAAAAESMAETGPALERSRELARDALADTRLAAERIRPPRLTELGLAGVLRSLGSAASGRIHVSVEADERRLPPEVELEAYRVVQEAVRNALTHASASRIDVSFTRLPEGVRIVVADDGVGFDPRAVPPRRLGIVGMAERADAIGGRLTVESVGGHGTRVGLFIPADGADVVGSAR
ncbi:MAG TPA: sensor histidine kinase [Candidatus Limnocylindrales bacterium]|nr:sensor histidine kinase [Candidatus Limnocylindrales bacterium]